MVRIAVSFDVVVVVMMVSPSIVGAMVNRSTLANRFRIEGLRGSHDRFMSFLRQPWQIPWAVTGKRHQGLALEAPKPCRPCDNSPGEVELPSFRNGRLPPCLPLNLVRYGTDLYKLPIDFAEYVPRCRVNPIRFEQGREDEFAMGPEVVVPFVMALHDGLLMMDKD
jgi:hypothetical protein